MERPRTSESAPVRGSNGGVRCARKSDPMNDRATTLFASQRQMAVPTDEEARRREPLTGATAIPRVKYGDQNHCASPITSGAFTLPKQCWQLSTMKRSGQLGWPTGTCPKHRDCGGSDPRPDVRQVLGCLARGPTGGRPAGSQLAAQSRLGDGGGEPVDNR